MYVPIEESILSWGIRHCCFGGSIVSFVGASGVAGGLLVKALDCGSKDPGFQSH